MERNLSKDILSYQLDQVHLNEGWITPIVQAVEETDFDAAHFRPAEGVATIRELVEHMVGWTEDLMYDLEGRTNPNVVDWPPVVNDTPERWDEVKKRLRTQTGRLQAALAEADEGYLGSLLSDGETTKGNRIAGVLVHNAYHSGQIIKLRQIYAARSAEAATV